MDDLSKATSIASFGAKAQAKRLRVISENLANADSLAKTPGGEPYRRKILQFRNQLDPSLEVDTVRADRTDRDMTDFGRKYDPGHPGADEQGYVMTPNVNPLIEVMDLREAQRSYEANLNTISISRDLLGKTLDLLR
ncbi:flagellar basal body rod protein FlgC [Haematospirillum jordaniae]|uniref:Flagellar basal-body rod protein FlgC n=1 Tax=Haematospirillum jordaniae TaxID=1549855 RepID=A0A143DAT0_9PROT|nr:MULTISPECIES: flagellar basal body rod protein FlgC [Haematospirillum]AMW33825.1 flagellar basal-body rod protein FlgC [Haematospirillum jordaniae]NKD44540.1 flagellar basal body rod protein FlgC [Haematospirillum jordaniae]NKD55839.1 flagellar basal body rod protein FlgC [Haematospirillum sp. H4890]NKD57560.1 flagellar basal body rod protein FlgC [Haematospirillum jordaniae]NKD59462.1 flagellar basal body rod protein FlgC [Haematospirillum jordaniae]